MFDLLIKGGLVLDGAANPGIFLSVAIKDNRIHLLRGDISNIKAHRTIDATGKVVSPGFIDVHAHSGLVILSKPEHMPKVHQGVTTELIGIDGNSYAPFHDSADLNRMVQINSGLDGDPKIDYDWNTVTDYLDKFDKKVSVNIAYVVGNSPLRVGAMGWTANKPSAKQLDQQKGLLREAMQEGAFGISTGLDYPPGNYADTDELVDIAKESSPKTTSTSGKISTRTFKARLNKVSPPKTKFLLSLPIRRLFPPANRTPVISWLIVMQHK